jgi:hypothetical protein
LKPAYNGTATDRIFFPCWLVPFHTVLELWILGSVPLKTGFRYSQALFKIGFTVNYSKKRSLSYEIPIHDTEYVSYIFLAFHQILSQRVNQARDEKSFSTLVGEPEGKGHLEDLGVKGIIMKSVLKKYIVRVWAADQ